MKLVMTTIFSSTDQRTNDEALTQIRHLFQQISQQTGMSVTCLPSTAVDLEDPNQG